MKLILISITDMYRTIQILSNQKLPLKGAFRLNQIANAIKPHNEFYAEKFGKIIEQYAKRDENGQPQLDATKTNVLIQEDKIQECSEKLNELNNLEVELSDNLYITLNDLGDIECSVQDLQGLTPVLREE